MTFAGTFTADGNGGITTGEEDYNSISGTPVEYTNLVGTYTLGADGRGTFTVDSDCVVHIEFGDTKLRGILVNKGAEILAIQIDPGKTVSARFTAQ